ncbi:hypothetical protein MRX96_006675 [Rhipicephalus microplus]
MTPRQGSHLSDRCGRRRDRTSSRDALLCRLGCMLLSRYSCGRTRRHPRRRPWKSRRSVDAKQSQSAAAAVPQIGARLCRHASATYRVLGPWIQDDAATGEARRSHSRTAPRYARCSDSRPRLARREAWKPTLEGCLSSSPPARARNNQLECLAEEPLPLVAASFS